MAQSLDKLTMSTGKRLQSRIWFFSLKDSENDINAIIQNLSNSLATHVFTILHDKDKILLDDGTYRNKELHHHFAIRFENPTTLQVIANLVLLDQDHYSLVQRAKSWRKSCRYMLHLDDHDKYPYNISEIVAIKGSKDDFYNFTLGKGQLTTSDNDLFPDFANFDKIPYSTQYTDIYKNVDDARRRNALLNELKKSYENYLDNRRYEMKTKDVKVIWVAGEPGSGKSTFAISLANNNNKSYCISSSSNDALQDYECQDYLILDDLRDDAFTLQDVVKLLDNHVISSVKSRYKNKCFLGECIVITSAMPLCDWYKKSKEDRAQLFRRISAYAYCHRDGDTLISDVYLTDDKTPAIDLATGQPNGSPIPTPILDLSKTEIRSVKNCWKSLGIDLDKLTNDIIQETINPK